MKTVETTVALMALAALAPATAFAPSAATGTAIRRSRGEYAPVGSYTSGLLRQSTPIVENVMIIVYQY